MIRKLAKNIGEYKKETILSPVFVILEVIIDVLIPLLMAVILDRGIDDGERDVLWIYGGVLVAAAVLSLLFGYAAGKYAAKASAGFAKNLRTGYVLSCTGFLFFQY